MRANRVWVFLFAYTAACRDSESSDAGNTVNGGTGGDTSSVDCSSASTDIEEVVCAADALSATLSSTEQDTLLYDFSDASAKTTWSNLPNATRNGLKFGDLTDASRAAVMDLAATVLSADGHADFVGGLAADDYLGTQGGSGQAGPGGGGYSSDNYYVAFIGTPSETGNWMLQIGGHHMAYNVTFLAGAGHPTPHHLGAEPKSSFTVNSETYAPMSEEGAALVALFGSLDATQLSSAYLQGQAFADVLIGPDDGSGVAPTDYPMGANRTGILVSSLSTAGQAEVTAAIQQWVGDYNPSIADALLAEYTSTAAYGDTYVAWGGTEAAGPDPDVAGTYFRIDGPRFWIEVACQSGIVIQGETHYHSIFRDKAMDYGNSL